MSEEIEVPTLARIRAALRERGLKPTRRYGQNFLTDAALLSRIVDEAALSPGDLVLEVGPGPGTLTAEILRRGARVVAVEIDPVMIELLASLLGNPPALTLLRSDILAHSPDLPAAVSEQLDRGGRGNRASYSVVSNLPYQVASTLLVDLFWGRTPARAVVTIQSEVADRLCARPGGKDYGPLSVMTQLRAEVRVARRISPACFWPRPNVDSACVVLTPRADPPGQGLPPAFLAEVVHAVFHARRKSLGNSLSLAFRRRIDRARLLTALEEKNFEKDRRGEELAPMDIVRLAFILEEEFRATGP